MSLNIVMVVRVYIRFSKKMIRGYIAGYIKNFYTRIQGIGLLEYTNVLRIMGNRLNCLEGLKACFNETKLGKTAIIY